jgi:hypothetical protein
MGFLQALSVYDVGSPKLRLGNPNDGGYILNQAILDNTERLISVGIGGEDAFELQWAAQYPNSVIEAYDGTYPCNNICHKFPDRINKNIFYVHNNVGFKEKDIPINVIADYKRNVLLKVDIEGAEYSIFDNFYPDTNLTGLILEVHDLHSEQNRGKLVKLIQENFKNLVLFHIHGNSWGGTFDLNLIPNSDNSVIVKNFPHVLELSFVSKHIVDNLCVDYTKFPILGLDTSNKPDAPDIDLYWVNSI